MEELDGLDTEFDMDLHQDNPEALFDFLTIKSLQDRLHTTTPPRKMASRKPIEREAVYQNEAEFETYVQQFPIDDSIAECFAMATEVEQGPSQTKFVSGGKRPQLSSKYNKLKKKFGWKQAADENMVAHEEFLSRDSKRSKKGGVFSKRHKWRGLGGSKKAVLFSDQSPPPNSDDVKVECIPPRAANLSPNDSSSISDSQITSYSETLTSEDQTVPLMRGDNSNGNGGFEHPGIFGVVNFGAELGDVDQDFRSIFRGDTTTIIQNLEDLHPDDAASMRDSHGNTLLHHAVTLSNADAVKFIIEKYPDMTSDMNNDNTTAVEVATKHGKYDCLRVILERNQRRKTLGPSLINRLLNISAQNGQGECLNLLLTYLSRDPRSLSSLPCDNRGNTAAHLAAKNGHLHCLQILMASGYDVTSENLIRQRPLHIAHQNRNETCFSFLLLLDVCEELLRINRAQLQPQPSNADVTSGLHSAVEQISTTLNRYGALLGSSRQALDESKDSILQTLAQLQNDLDLYITHTECDTAYKRKAARKRLEELRGEIEQLEDIFEFAPITEMDGVITRLLGDVTNTLNPITDNGGVVPQSLDVSMSDEEIGHVLSSLIKDIYKEFMLENWNVGHVFERYLGVLKSKSGCDAIYNTPLDLDTSGEQIVRVGQFKTCTSKHLDQNMNISVENQGCQTDIIEESKCPRCGNERRYKSSNIDRDIDTDIEREVEAARRLIEASEQGARNDRIKTNALIGDKTEKQSAPSHLQDTKLADERGRGQPDTATPTERPFAKLLSLDERMELLISGERSKLKVSDSSHTLVDRSGSPEEVHESMTTTTFTSITSDATSGLSDWYSKLGFSSLETSPDDVTHEVTSETPSYWWDVGDDQAKVGGSILRKPDALRENIRRQIHLNLENEDSTLEELRLHRLRDHLNAVQQTRYPSDNYTEKITTATGEVIGGFPSRATCRDDLIGSFSDEPIGGFQSRDDSAKIVIDVNGALQKRLESNAKPRRHHEGDELFTLVDAINSSQSRQENYYGRYNVRSRDVFETSPGDRFGDTSYTDDDDSRSIPWYELEGVGQSIRWKSSSETSDDTATPQSFV